MMNTMLFSKTVLRFLAFACISLTVHASETSDDKHLNVLFIAVDDLRPEFGAYGADHVVSPNLDKFAAESMLFNRAYCQQAVCSPSRTSLMTGLRPDSTKVYDLNTHFRDTVPDVVTLGQHFKENGYYVLGMGKIYHGNLDDKHTWSRRTKQFGGWPPYVEQENIDTFNRLQKEHRESGNPGYGVVGPATEAPDIEDSEHPEGEMTDYAIRVLDQLKNRDEPFFLAVGYSKPHLPFVAPKRYWDLYDRDAIEVPANYYTAPPQGIPNGFRNSWSGEMGMYQLPEWEMIHGTRIFPEDFAKELIHGYYACVSFVDAQIGRLLQALEDDGLADDTVVVLWGDHGFHLGDHGTWVKHTNFEVATRSPLIFHVPGMKSAGTKTDALVEFVDIYPSLAEACGLPVPEACEGLSFMPLIKDPSLEWKDAAFSQYPFTDYETKKKYMGYSMRTDRYRYTEHVNLKTDEVDFRELYDHENDPEENINLAINPEYAQIIEELSIELNEGWQAAAQEVTAYMDR